MSTSSHPSRKICGKASLESTSRKVITTSPTINISNHLRIPPPLTQSIKNREHEHELTSIPPRMPAPANLFFDEGGQSHHAKTKADASSRIQHWQLAHEHTFQFILVFYSSDIK